MNKVYITANKENLIPALVSKFSILRNTATNEIDVEIIIAEDVPNIQNRDGQPYLRKQGKESVWSKHSTPYFGVLRFLIPQLMNFDGKALVIDHDIMVVGDVQELFNMDMDGKAIIIRPGHEEHLSQDTRCTSAMLLDCSKLRHWDFDNNFAKMFDETLDYADWFALKDEPAINIGYFDTAWNDFDSLSDSTKAVHFTERDWQPWKQGMITAEPEFFIKHIKHPNDAAYNYFFKLLREALDQKSIDEDLVRSEIQKKHVRPDLLTIAKSLY